MGNYVPLITFDSYCDKYVKMIVEILNYYNTLRYD